MPRRVQRVQRVENEETCSFCKCLKLSALSLVLMLYELICFVGFVSLSIGIGAGLRIILKYTFNFNIPVYLETYCSWYCLAVSTEMHLRLYKRCIYPKIRQNLRKHPNILQGLPRIIYFTLWFIAVCGICYEYESIHSHPSLSFPRQVRNESHPPPHVTKSPEKMKEDVANEKFHTALFLMSMSYLIYSTGQILCNFLVRINRGLPTAPACPQMYATIVMMILQAILTFFYSFPIGMTLFACYLFYVDGASAYMFSLCLATSVSMAAAQLESESPFPTQGRAGPFYYFESLHRSRVNLIFLLLPFVAYCFFQKNSNVTGSGNHYHYFTFCMMVTLMHTIKSLYLTTWHPVRPAPAVGQNAHVHPVHPAVDPQVNPNNDNGPLENPPVVHHLHVLPQNKSETLATANTTDDPIDPGMNADPNENDVEGDKNPNAKGNLREVTDGQVDLEESQIVDTQESDNSQAENENGGSQKDSDNHNQIKIEIKNEVKQTIIDTNQIDSVLDFEVREPQSSN